MDVTLPADLTKQVEQELVNGHYRSRDELIEQAVRHFFDERQRGQQRLDALQFGVVRGERELHDCRLSRSASPRSKKAA